jgi:hypothetical protein
MPDDPAGGDAFHSDDDRTASPIPLGPPPPPEALPHPGAGRDSAPAPAPPVPGPRAGGPGWGVRDQRPAPGLDWDLPPHPAGTVAPTESGQASNPAAGSGPDPARRSRTGLGAFLALALIIAVAAGAAITLWPGSNSGLGSGTHGVSAPLTLGGFAQNSNPELQSVGLTLQSELQADSASTTGGLLQTVTAFYGSTDRTGTGMNPDYLLFMMSFRGQLTASDLTTMANGVIDSGSTSVETRNGVSFYCGTTMGGDVLPSACVWVDGNVLGVVEGAARGGSSATLAAAEDARGSAEH